MTTETTEATKAAAAAPEPKMPVYALASALIIDRDNAFRGYWLYRAPSTHTPEDVIQPEYFGSLANKLKVGDIIEVQNEDLTWYAELMVRAAPRGIHQVITVVRHITFFAGEAGDLPRGWSIRYLGPESKHVIYNKDERVEGGFDSWEDAAEQVKQIIAKAARQAAGGPTGPRRQVPADKTRTEKAN